MTSLAPPSVARRPAPRRGVTLTHNPLTNQKPTQPNQTKPNQPQQELYAFLQVQAVSELVVDRSPPNELLKITFNVSFPALSCEFATLDVSDELGTKRMNLTKTVRKSPIDLHLQRVGAHFVDEDSSTQKAAPKYDSEDTWYEHVDVALPLSRQTFDDTLAHYPIVVVNFYAPWCHWCQRLEPAWDAATAEVHGRYPDKADGRIRYAKVDCVAETELCRQHFITAFPSLRVFRRGHDDLVVQGMHEHEAYTGDRTKDALVAFADSLVPSAGSPHTKHALLMAAPRTAGCNMAGFVMVKKVPGTLHFTARAEGHSFDHAWMNLTHAVHALHFGAKPTPRKLRALERLHPAGLQEDWLDKMAGLAFFSDHAQHTHEHWLSVVLTSVVPLRGGLAARYDAYEYSAVSNTFISDSTPSARFSYGISPIQVVVREAPRHWYRFLTTTCAIVGGVYTVAGMLDGVAYTGWKIAKKVELGKAS